MYQYLVKFRVNGIRTETIVSAYSPIHARKLVQEMYDGSKIMFINIEKISK